jgi:hypothetical protein
MSVSGGPTVKKRKEGRRKQKVASPPSRLNGFDFGVDQLGMTVSDFQFNNLLQDAKVFACTYGRIYRHDIGANVPIISLAATEPDPLKAAFEVLKGWDREPGDDGFSLEFILRRDGGYLVAISPDFETLLSRVNKSDRFFTQFGVNVSWIKDFPARGPWVTDFRAYLAKPVAPFVFTGCKWVAEDQTPRHMPGFPEILKFEAHFSEEGATVPGTFGHAMLELRREAGSRGQRRLPPKPQQTPEAIHERRAEQLKRHFPVTLWRNDERAFEAFRSRNAALGVLDWQWQQANCDLALSIEMISGPYYPGLTERQLVAAIAQRLVGRIELANMPSRPVCSDDILIKQLFLDGCYLLQNQGRRNSPRTPADLRGRLAQEGLL